MCLWDPPYLTPGFSRDRITAIGASNFDHMIILAAIAESEYASGPRFNA
jgi:hypothetical protein